jgi:hypothetical protein
MSTEHDGQRDSSQSVSPDVVAKLIAFAEFILARARERSVNDPLENYGRSRVVFTPDGYWHYKPAPTPNHVAFLGEHCHEQGVWQHPATLAAVEAALDARLLPRPQMSRDDGSRIEDPPLPTIAPHSSPRCLAAADDRRGLSRPRRPGND